MKLIKFMSIIAAIALMQVAATQAQANVLANPGFEDAGLSVGGEVGGAPGWTAFGAAFTQHSSLVGAVGANTGDHALKTFGGCCGGVFQDFPTAPGQIWNGGAHLLNLSTDQMANGQVAAVNIEWKKANGDPSDIIPFISNGTFTADDAPVDEWTLKTVTGAAPADAATARLTLITGDFLPGGPGGAPYFDDAFFEVIPEPGTLFLAAGGILGLLATRRR